MAEPRVTQQPDGTFVIVDDDLGTFVGRTFEDAKDNYTRALQRNSERVLREGGSLWPGGAAPPQQPGLPPMGPQPAPPGFRGMAPPDRMPQMPPGRAPMSEQPLTEEELKRALAALLGRRGGLQERNPQGIQSLWDAMRQGGP